MMSQPSIRPSFCSTAPVLTASSPLLCQGHQEGDPPHGGDQDGQHCANSGPCARGLAVHRPHQLTLGWPFRSLTFPSAPSGENAFTSTGEKYVRPRTARLSVFRAQHRTTLYKRGREQGDPGTGRGLQVTSLAVATAPSPFLGSFFLAGGGAG